MDKIDVQEKILGGIFGIIAIAASICEMFANGVNAASVFGMIKDISGTLIVVIVMITMAKLLIPKKYEKSFEERLTNALESWVENNSTMAVHNEKMDGKDCYGIGIKTDMNEFYKDVSTSKNVGWFVRLPIISEENYNHNGIEINFHLNKGTFFGKGHEMSAEEEAAEFSKLSTLFSQFINQKFPDFANASGKNDNIKVVLKDPIISDDDIEKLVELINTMYTAYLVSSHIKIK